MEAAGVSRRLGIISCLEWCAVLNKPTSVGRDFMILSTGYYKKKYHIAQDFQVSKLLFYFFFSLLAFRAVM